MKTEQTKEMHSMDDEVFWQFSQEVAQHWQREMPGCMRSRLTSHLTLQIHAECAGKQDTPLMTVNYSRTSHSFGSVQLTAARCPLRGCAQQLDRDITDVMTSQRPVVMSHCSDPTMLWCC